MEIAQNVVPANSVKSAPFFTERMIGVRNDQIRVVEMVLWLH